MIRDHEYIRDLLLKTEASDESVIDTTDVLEPSEEIIKRTFHARLLSDAGYAVPIGEDYRITDRGHAFLEMIKDDAIWSDIKEQFIDIKYVGLLDIEQIAIKRIKLRYG